MRDDTRPDDIRPDDIRPDDIQHDGAHRRFTLDVDGEQAFLRYEMRGPSLMDAVQTWTPPSARGRGIASRLTRAALDHVRASGWRVHATCWYVDGWIDRHPDYADLRA